MKKTNLILILSVLIGLAMNLPVWANNVEVENTSLTGQSTAGDQSTHYTYLKFDISWENSWRTSAAPNNWDAVWVFAKYNIVGDDPDLGWKHCTLNTSGHTAPTGSTIDVGTTGGVGTGIFIYRDAVGDAGSVDWDNAKLRWNYGDDVADDAKVDVKVFAIEMVYVPQASFYVGSGGTETSAFYKYPTTTNAYQITNENAITVGTTNDNLYYPSSTYGGDQNGPIPAAFPKGYNAFYCMKYEISQGQYANFLNTLTYDQQNTRTATAPNSTGQVNGNLYRNGLEVQTAGTDNTVPAVYGIDLNNDDGNLGSNIACNYLNWADVAAYSDWSGLRPMTELEFEKAGRGTLVAVANEYAWGSQTISGLETGAPGTRYEENDGYDAASSSIDDNCHYNNSGNWNTGGGPYGPVRCGSFATSLTDRQKSGASYYGIMELSGNLWERPVTVGNTTGRAFTGTNGNGVIDVSGNADASNWPNTTATGAGFRGGSWSYGATYLRLSDRITAAHTYSNRSINYGGRGVRVAP